MNDSIETLVEDIKASISRAEGNLMTEVECNRFADRYRELDSDLEKQYDDFHKLGEVEIKELDEHLKQMQRLAKSAIFWSLLALFFLWADVDISSQNSSSIFGLSISGLENGEVSIGFIVYLFLLFARLLWAVLKLYIIGYSVLNNIQFITLSKKLNRFYGNIKLIKSLMRENHVGRKGSEMVQSVLHGSYAATVPKISLIPIIENIIPLIVALVLMSGAIMVLFICGISQYYNLSLIFNFVFLSPVAAPIILILIKYISWARWVRAIQ